MTQNQRLREHLILFGKILLAIEIIFFLPLILNGLFIHSTILYELGYNGMPIVVMLFLFWGFGVSIYVKNKFKEQS